MITNTAADDEQAGIFQALFNAKTMEAREKMEAKPTYKKLKADHNVLVKFIERWSEIIQGGDKLERLQPWAKDFINEARQAIAEAERG